MYTYTIESQGLYKIGKAKNVEKRIKAYKTHNPMFKLIKTIEGDYEEQLHIIYKNKRSHLEWFNLTQDDVLNVENIINRDPEKDKSSIKLGAIKGKLIELTPHTFIIKSAANRVKAMSLSAGAIKMYTYIVYTIKPGMSTIKISAEQYEKEVKNGSRNTYKRAVEELTKTEYIYKTTEKNVYRVNPNYIHSSSII
jgi:hypothetical protein